MNSSGQPAANVTEAVLEANNSVPLLAPITSSATLTEASTDTPMVTSFASYAARNPGLPRIQPAPSREKRTYTKQSIEVNRQLREDQKDTFLADLKALQEAQEKAIHGLAEKYHRKPKYMEKLVKHQSLYKQRRRANIWNAKVSKKAKELNKGKPPGQCVDIKVIRQAVRDDPKLVQMDKDEEATLRTTFEKERDNRRKGARINNKAATLDYNNTVNSIEQEMQDLHFRTGIDAFGFFSRAHVNDTMQPAWVSSTPDAMNFLPETMQTTAGEMGRHFELWSCTKGDKKGRNELVTLQSECSEMIVQRLCEITNRRNITMSYHYYEVDIKARWNVELKGWPQGVEFKAPGKITTMWEVRTLYTALLSGQCHWKPMPQGAIDALMKKLTENPVKKTRKPRKRKNSENNENVAPSERTAAGVKRRKGPKSAAVVVDIDE